MFRNDKKNEKKFLEKIEDQELKIVRYETRLRDVVKAYKSLQKEKEALEATVKALSTTTNKEFPKKPRKTEQEKNVFTDPLSPQECSNASSDSLEHERSINEDDDVGFDDKEDKIEMLNEKVSTLSRALATVTEEKSKMEAAFQADKKLGIQEQEKRLRESDEQMEMLETKYAEVEAKMKEMKSRLRLQQSELEAEQMNNASMLKEMQQLLATERLGKEELKIRLQEKRDANTSKSNEDAKIYEKKIQQLSEELAKVSTRLKKYEDAASQPSPLLLQLSDEMTGLKRHHTDAICKERQRANEAEDTLKQFSSMEEERIAVLETKLAELSEVVGNYEKLRYQDQLVISNLKERLSQLDLASSSINKQITSPEIEMIADNQASEMKEQMLKMKSLLRLTWNKSPPSSYDSRHLESEPISVAELDSILHNDPAHRACQLEYKQLKDEFENYKKESKTKKKDELLEGTPKEFLKLKEKSEDLVKELEYLRNNLSDKERGYIDKISCLKCDMTRLADEKAHEIQGIEECFKGKILMLELQLTKQRERTLQLIADKDLEIKRLKGDCEFPSPIEKRNFDLYRSNDVSSTATSPLKEDDDAVKRSVETEVAVKQLLSRQNSAGSESTLVYYVQQMSQLQNEIASLRNRNLELETLIRNDEHREEQIVDQMNILKDEIRKLERNRSRENANLEYVKNVVLRYMVSDSISVKEQLTKAIGTVLQFSPAEMNDILKKHTGWWPSQQK